MNEFTKRLLKGEILTPDEITPEEATQTFREFRMLLILGFSKECMIPGILKFVLNPIEFGFKDALVNGLERNNFYDELSYLEVKEKITDLLQVMRDDLNNIDSHTISVYNDLAHRNNVIVKQLVELGGDFRAYYEGQLVESRRTL